MIIWNAENHENILYLLIKNVVVGRNDIASV